MRLRFLILFMAVLLSGAVASPPSIVRIDGLWLGATPRELEESGVEGSPPSASALVAGAEAIGYGDTCGAHFLNGSAVLIHGKAASINGNIIAETGWSKEQLQKSMSSFGLSVVSEKETITDGGRRFLVLTYRTPEADLIVVPLSGTAGATGSVYLLKAGTKPPF